MPAQSCVLMREHRPNVTGAEPAADRYGRRPFAKSWRPEMRNWAKIGAVDPARKETQARPHNTLLVFGARREQNAL